MGVIVGCVGVIMLLMLVVLLVQRHRRLERWRWDDLQCDELAQEYRRILVADTTYEELSSLGLGMCLLRAMVLLDSRLVHYWSIEVAPEWVPQVRAKLWYHELRILDVGCSKQEALTRCLEDRASRERWCPGCGGERESLAVKMCADCISFFTAMGWDKEDDEL